MSFLLEMIGQGLDRIGDGDTVLLSTIGRTLALAVVSTALALALGVPLALWLADRGSRPRRAGLVVANAGLGLPPVVLGVFLALLLLPASPLGGLGWTYTLQAMILAQTLLALPIVVALVASALRSLPPGLLSQASAFGASRIDVAALALREARIGVLAAVITALGSALAEVGAVVIVGGNSRGQTNTLASTVLLDLSAGDPAGATANVLVLVGLMLLLGLALTVVQQRLRPRASRRPRLIGARR